MCRKDSFSKCFHIRKLLRNNQYHIIVSREKRARLAAGSQHRYTSPSSLVEQFLLRLRKLPRSSFLKFCFLCRNAPLVWSFKSIPSGCALGRVQFWMKSGCHCGGSNERLLSLAKIDMPLFIQDGVYSYEAYGVVYL